MCLVASNRNTPLIVAKMKTFIISYDKKSRGRVVIGLINSGLYDVFKDWRILFQSLTLPPAACWRLLSVLSAHVPKVASSRLAHPHTIITKGWWGKGMAFLLFWGEKSLFFYLHCSSKLPLRSPWLGLGQCPYPNCKGSWGSRYMAVGAGSPGKEEELRMSTH